jgi:hypothetical protein
MPYPGYAFRTKPFFTLKGLRPRRRAGDDPNGSPLGFPKGDLGGISQGSSAALGKSGLEDATPLA